jgi:hypothetical protein
MPQTPTQLRARTRRSEWFKLFRRWRHANNYIGVMSVILSATASVTSSFAHRTTAGLTLGAAMLTGAVSFLEPSKRAKGYISAWRRLDRALGAQEAGDPQMTDIELNNQIAAGEDDIDKSE